MESSRFELVSHRPEETQAIGRLLGAQAMRGDVFLLVGELGAGKTCLTQGIVWGLGSREYARSPSFVLVSQYQGRLTTYHIDLYRLDSIQEIADLGLDGVSGRRRRLRCGVGGEGDRDVPGAEPDGPNRYHRGDGATAHADRRQPAICRGAEDGASGDD